MKEERAEVFNSRFAYPGHHARATSCERVPSERVRDVRVAAGRLGLHVVRPG